ncbi:MAG TPA: hypothetical protein VFB22_08290 [Candidatus Baltobacteraceae bacterium]|nr:hypothetical protein [Candidatus Baltobacteraceae bacterium]
MKEVCKEFARGQITNRASPTYGFITLPIEQQIIDVAETFVALQELRHIADYDLSRTFDRLDVRSTVALVRSAFQSWEQVRGSQNARTFLAALLFEKQWKRA